MGIEMDELAGFQKLGLTMQEAADALTGIGLLAAQVWAAQLRAVGFEDAESFLAWRREYGVRAAFNLLEGRGLDYYGWPLAEDEYHS